MDHVFDELSDLITAPAYDWRAKASALLLKLLGNAATRMAIGIGVAVGMALAG
jgi:hypothetical protein